ncbi:hypothetical protein Tco_0426323 [Tanacetum coccineum]
MSIQNTGLICYKVSRSWISLVTNILKRSQVRRQDDNLYKFLRRRLQKIVAKDIEGYGHIVIQDVLEDLQLAVEAIRRRINLTKPEITIHASKKGTPYTAYMISRHYLSDYMNRIV